MPNNYRVYRLDRAHHVVEIEWVAATSDEEAVAAARAMKGEGKREVWLGERLVATVHPAAAGEPSGAIWL
jgi:hypothetical protein